MDVLKLLALLFLVISCVPQSQVTTASQASSKTAGGTAGGTTTPTSPTTTWNFLGTNTNLITINASNLNNAHIVGAPVEKFLATANTSGTLSNFSGAEYCIIANFNLNGTPAQLRSRVIPISYFDLRANTTVRVLRVDFNDTTNSSSQCNLAVRVFNGTGSLVVEPFATPQFDPALVCPTCTSNLTSTKIRLFKRGTTLDEVATNLVSLSAMTLKIDPNSNTNNGSTTCSNSECVSRGFDCCLDNQCVEDGSTRPSASNVYPTQLATAEAERLQNPLAYLNYPHLFYICGNSIPGTTGGTSGDGSYDAAFEALKSDYNCIQDLKNLADSDPFHSDTLLAPGAHPFGTSTNCLTGAAQTTQTMFYQNVMKRLYQTCGCAQTELVDMVASCPAYDYVVSASNTLGVPTRIDCFTPAELEPPIPTNQNVNVSARSAPHRFFDSTGTERELTINASFTQEGDTFFYNDSGFLLPVQQNLGMNSILGQMSVTLDKALPAKIVNVDVDQVYVISTRQGFYTPCPTCSKDSWLSTLSAYPSTAFGTGLQAIGHTTTRDEAFTNITGGNYEDTIFGRACWIPPTMIPFTHASEATVPTQRTNRLNAQAAMYINGYQRDWFGFNKGATIGSFDGVTWFAIGKGRIVRSTSKRLFLAINAPFADVASPTIQTVNVQAFDGISQVAGVDYDPTLHLSHPLQNEAGNCQASHFCSTDTDCITRLGWEYMCADVKDMKTRWPTFDVDGNEKIGTSTVSIEQILQQKRFPTSSSKRCIYRGAGALCGRPTTTGSSNEIQNLNSNTKRFNTCAPNFYCANMTSEQVFNTKIARFAGALEDIPVIRNHLYGKDANMLGRPLHYIATPSSVATGEMTTFSSTIASTLQSNYKLSVNVIAQDSRIGMCRPGKDLSINNPITQHASGDSSARTDFISQIASCNSTNYIPTANNNNTDRYSSCPVIGSDGNYSMFNTSFFTLPFNTTESTDHAQRARHQNSCGLETLSTDITNSDFNGGVANTIANFSPFKLIEAKPLSDTSQTIIEPTLARDACLRRAGQVCHTDLDCGPNKFHAAQVDFFATKFFGNEAEKDYYSESLVCAQANAKPFPSETTAFKDFNMSLNRCCREIGKDITTYTADVPTNLAGTTYESITDELMGLATTDSNHRHVNRYSRYLTVENLGTADRPFPSAFQIRVAGLLSTRTKSLGIGSMITSPVATNTRTTKQWATIGEANTESCCGGGWIRKFADGTNNWLKRDRLVMDVTNFKCINSMTVLLTNPSLVSATATALVADDFIHYCQDPSLAQGGCAQFGISSGVTETQPTILSYKTAVVVNTLDPAFSDNPGAEDTELFFSPRSADSDPNTFFNYTTTDARRNIVIKVPSYITRSFERAPLPTINLVDETGALSAACTSEATVANITTPTQEDGQGGVACGGGACCFHYNPSTRILKVVPDNAAVGGAIANDEDYGVRFTFDSIGSGAAALGGTITRTTPGNDIFYLNRLRLFELIGIPQIGFLPILCNDDSSKLVPGLYASTITTQTQFNLSTNSYHDGSAPTVKYTNQYGLNHEPIFSAHEFKCCTPLGKVANSIGNCCSGFGTATDNTNTKFTCKIPEGADLMVYFNRFVSSEGVSSDQPGGGLVEADFDALTGFPLLTTSVNQKIAALGNAFCENSSIRQGGVFGQFRPEPQGPDTRVGLPFRTITDSSNDFATVSNAGSSFGVGFFDFMNGFRWNNHLYCNEN